MQLLVSTFDFTLRPTDCTELLFLFIETTIYYTTITTIYTIYFN